METIKDFIIYCLKLVNDLQLTSQRPLSAIDPIGG